MYCEYNKEQEEAYSELWQPAIAPADFGVRAAMQGSCSQSPSGVPAPLLTAEDTWGDQPYQAKLSPCDPPLCPSAP